MIRIARMDGREARGNEERVMREQEEDYREKRKRQNDNLTFIEFSRSDPAM